MSAPLTVGDIVRFKTSFAQWRVDAISVKGDRVDLRPRDRHGRRKWRVDTSRLVRLGR